MSIDWPTIKPLIASIMKDLSGLSTKPRWMDEEEASTWGDVPMVFLRLSPVETQGQEEEFVATPDPNQPTINPVTVVAGQRRFKLTVRVESFEQHIESPNFAGNVGEKIKIGLKRSTTQARYAGIFAIENRLATIWFDYKDEDDRQVSCYIMEIQCRTVNNDVDDSLSAGNYISEVQAFSNAVKYPGPDGGTPTDSQINLDVKG